MQAGMKRGLVAGASVVIAAGIGVVTNVATDRTGLAWWVSLGALLLIGVATQIWLTASEGQQATVTASGHGSVAVGGSTHRTVSTRARTSAPPTAISDAGAGINARGPGSIAIGGEARGDLTTDAEGAE